MMTPGIFLREKLEENQMSRKELAQRTGVTEKHISTVINDERGISASFARKLGYAIEGTTAADWLKVQAEYDAEQLRLKEGNNVGAEEIAILKPLHDITKYFIELGYMHNECGDISKVLQLRSLLNISNLSLIPKVTYNAAYRTQITSNVKVDPYVLFAWQKLCEKSTEKISVPEKMDTALLRQKLPEIKNLMFDEINKGILALQDIFAECGIAFQVVKNFRGAPVQGFIKQMPGEKLIMCLTIRGKRADTFWFTLFHEIAHVLNGDYSVRFVDFDSVEGAAEKKADVFAADFLINPNQYKAFLHTPDCTTWDGIEKFAKTVGVQPYIVLGRLQNDKILDWTQYTDKIVRYSWA